MCGLRTLVGSPGSPVDRPCGTQVRRNARRRHICYDKLQRRSLVGAWVQGGQSLIPSLPHLLHRTCCQSQRKPRLDLVSCNY
eukprot:364500-Chlamydomonas_euryale.AAC.3